MTTTVRAAPLSSTDLFKKISPSVWLVKTFDADGLPLSTGSAVVIASDTLITNCHVLAKAKRFTVSHETRVLSATLDLWDVQRDLCQVKAAGLQSTAVGIENSDTVVVGQTVYALGNPKGYELTFSSGLVSALRKNPAAELVRLQISAPISHGSSGGGLFDEQGQLIGITSGGVDGGTAQNLNFAIPSNWIAQLPARHLAARAQSGSVSPGQDQPGLKQVIESSPRAVPSAVVPPQSVRKPLQVEPPEVSRTITQPALSGQAQQAYQTYMGRGVPKAFALGPAGRFGWASGNRASQPSSPTDPTRRALENCERATGPASCVLYSVNGELTGAAPPPTAPIQNPTVAAPTAPVAVQQSTPTGGNRYVLPKDSHFADVNDAGAVPVGPEGRHEYLRFLSLPMPRAFAISTEGGWSVSSSSVSAAADVLNGCQRDGRTCWLYAVDDHVVWQADRDKRIGKVSQLALAPSRSY